MYHGQQDIRKILDLSPFPTEPVLILLPRFPLQRPHSASLTIFCRLTLRTRDADLPKALKAVNLQQLQSLVRLMLSTL